MTAWRAFLKDFFQERPPLCFVRETKRTIRQGTLLVLYSCEDILFFIRRYRTYRWHMDQAQFLKNINQQVLHGKMQKSVSRKRIESEERSNLYSKYRILLRLYVSLSFFRAVFYFSIIFDIITNTLLYEKHRECGQWRRLKEEADN